ncbi:glycosyltransferase family 9 protein [Ktedonosporobacter rubrisoli]|uniref:Glycosyltransferase family 9 protein n=1 Tax=Ktedonosporobacter rubrisoli TaxID=2509675 RepID=A0A4P6K3G0_KTERU|nr:glycosyltransferase family 9 protein [Ktedonosporobacter rubrisoli]QBD82026.1 glycosyltransferase family 9 protein [Ktedonosporobacter rubrisoli]
MKKLLRAIPTSLVRLVGAVTAGRSAYKHKSQETRFLLVRPGNLGDMVLATPIVRAIKASVPGAHITMLVPPWASEVVKRHPDVDEILECPFPSSRVASQTWLESFKLLFHTARRLRDGQYSMGINLRPRFWWGAALLYLANIPYRIGFNVGSVEHFLTTALPYERLTHATASCLTLAGAGIQKLGYPALEQPYTPERYPFYFVPTAEEQQWAAERLEAEGIDLSVPLIIVHPGTGALIKLWRASGWSSCITALSRALREPRPVQIVLTGSPGERALLKEVARGTPARTTIISDTTVGQLAALQQRAQLVLGVDSGPLHLAIAQGTPTVQIFGPTDVRNYGPWGPKERHVVVTSTYRCASCTSIPCGRLHFANHELVDHPCVRKVSDEDVLAAISQVLGRPITLPQPLVKLTES